MTGFFVIVALAQAVASDVRFDLSNVAYMLFGIGAGMTVSALRFGTRMALMEQSVTGLGRSFDAWKETNDTRLDNIERAMFMRRPPAHVAPAD